MNTEPITNLCPKCGGTIPSDAPQGLCPRCVLAGAARPTDNGLKPGERLTAPPLETVAAAFPQLEIIELIGLGGMGVVYKARQPKLDRLVALKLLPQSLSADPAFAERFHREARFLARLNHPNIVTVFDFGQSGGFCFLLLEFVDGVNLRQAMQAGRFSPAEALAIVPSICGALQYAHDQGVLHRDIKPENILLDARGAVKLADFGIAKLVREPGDTCADVTLTQSGARLGTPHYMAPEQIERPSEVDHRADIYSLGVVFYELLTGELPLGRFAPPSEKADLDARVDAIVFRALAKERELRQQSAGEVKTEVESVTSTPRSSRREEAQPSASPRLLKTGGSTITTPERLATFSGQIFLYRSRGQLILDDRQLTHSCGGTTTVIPLATIRDLSIGRYPRAMNPVGLNFLSVSYDEGGQTKRVFLSPMEGFFGLPSSWNQRVADWFHAIRDAAHTATGRIPATTPANRLNVPAGSKGIYLLMLASLVIGVAPLFLLTVKLPGATSIFPQFMIVAFLIGLFALAGVVFFKAGRVFFGDSAGSSPVPLWRRRLGGVSLALAGLSHLVAIFHITIAPASYMTIARFRVDGPSSPEVFAAFAATVATHHRAVEFKQYNNNTSIYEIIGYGSSPEEAVRNANEAYAVLELVPSLKPELIDPPWPPIRPFSPNRFKSLVLGFLGFIGFGLLGLWLLRHERGGATERDQNPVPAPNPWPHRLFWLVLGLILLPAAAVVAALVAPVLLGSGLRGAGSLFAGIIPMTTGALLVVGFLRTRPTAAPAQPRSQWNPWPQRIFWTVLLAVVTPVLLLVVGLVVPRVLATRQPLRLLPTAVPANLDAAQAAADRPVQLSLRERMVSDSGIKLSWNLRSPVPATARLSVGGQSQEVHLTSHQPDGNYFTAVTARFNRDTNGHGIMMTVSAGDDTSEAGILHVPLTGDPAQLFIKANELVADDLPLKFNAPIWIAFAGLEQIRLEVLPASSLPRLPNGVSSAVGLLPQILPAGTSSAAALKWHFAWQRLEEQRKRVEVGAAAPSEMLAAERDQAVAEAEFRNAPWIAAEANVTYAQAMIEITRRMLEAGKATQAELNDAMLARAQAEEFAEKHRPPPSSMLSDPTHR